MYEKELTDLRNDASFLGKEQFSLDDLSHLIAFLASGNGCPWDRIQTAKSLQKNLLEEAYEAYDAIENGNATELREELGDLLLQIVFQANLAEGFTLQGVLDGISKKMIDRHTHVFGSDQVANTAEVLDVWDANKRKEKAQLTHAEALGGVTRALPALDRSNQKFLQRFAAVETRIKKDNKEMEELSLVELDQYWDQVKKDNQ